MRVYRYVLLGLALLAAGLCPRPLAAQAVQGTLLGRVTDSTGAAIPGATVTARQVQTGYTRTITANTTGEYLMPYMPVGIYDITAKEKGFAVYVRHGVQLAVGDNARADLQMALSSVSQTVQVTEAAGMVNTQTSEVGALIDQKRIVDLPLSGRNVLALTALLPGVSDVSAPQSFDTARFGPTMHIDGTRSDDSGEFLDGSLDITLFRSTGLNLPPPDAIQEFAVVTNSYSAEYGRVPGGAVNAVTRSGTNQFHGTMYEFLRNNKLDARNFFSSSVPNKKQNQFGFSLGYYVPLPAHKRLYLFGNYEGLRIRQDAIGNEAILPTASERQGNFSDRCPDALGSMAQCPRDPNTGQPYPNNTIPQNQLNPVAQAILQKLPVPTAADGTLQSAYSAPENLNQYFIRGDYDINQNNRLMVHVHRWKDGDQFDQSRSTDVPGWSPGFQYTYTWNLAAALTSTITPTLLNELRLGYNQTYSPGGNKNHFDLHSFGSNFPSTNTPPYVDVGGEFTLEPQIDGVNKDHVYQYSDTLTWIKGAHTIRTGAQIWNQRSTFVCNYLVESFTEFNGSFTGDPIADFLLGKPSLFQSEEPQTIDDVKSTIGAGFVQDDYKVAQHLTLNLGLRYEVQTPWASPQHLFATIRQGQQSTVFPAAPTGMVYVGDKGVPPGLVPTHKNHFAPRVGFAWDVFGDGKTAVRGGVGIFYGSMIAAAGQFANSQPFQVFRSYDIPPGGLSDPLKGEPPAFPNGTNFILPVALSYLSPDITQPYYEQANLTIQRQLGTNWSVQLGYVGSFGRHLVQQTDWNPAIPGPTATLSNIEQRRAYMPGVFTDGLKTTTDGNSSYHSMQLSIQHRMTRNFQVNGSYTWSRSLDTMSGYVEDATVSNPFNPHFDYAPSDFNRTHVVSLSWVYNLPRLTSMAAPIRKVAGGWELTGISSFKSGLPIDIETDQDVLAIGTYRSYLQRPDLVGNPIIDHTSKADYLHQYFNKAAFALPCTLDQNGNCVPGTGHWGNLGRNALIGPGYANWDLGLFKNTSIGERYNVQFRTEFLNAFNHANFSNPNPYMDSSRFGRITRASAGREIQFGLKLMF